MAKKPNTKDNVLVNTAKAIGTAAGKVVSLVGAAPAGTPVKKGKLPKKDKPRLPRRLKKAQKKAAKRTGLEKENPAT
jgi:hypothetical protein